MPAEARCLSSRVLIFNLLFKAKRSYRNAATMPTRTKASSAEHAVRKKKQRRTETKLNFPMSQKFMHTLHMLNCFTFRIVRESISLGAHSLSHTHADTQLSIHHVIHISHTMHDGRLPHTKYSAFASVALLPPSPVFLSQFLPRTFFGLKSVVRRFVFRAYDVSAAITQTTPP